MQLVGLLAHWNHRYERTVVSSFSELNNSIGQSEQGMVFPNSYILAWVVSCSSLSNNDITSNSRLTTEDLHSKSLAF